MNVLSVVLAQLHVAFLLERDNVLLSTYGQPLPCLPNLIVD